MTRCMIEWIRNGERAYGRVVERTDRGLVVEFDHEPGEEYEFEKDGNDRFWHEVNNFADPVKIVEGGLS